MTRTAPPRRRLDMAESPPLHEPRDKGDHRKDTVFFRKLYWHMQICHVFDPELSGEQQEELHHKLHPELEF